MLRNLYITIFVLLCLDKVQGQNAKINPFPEWNYLELHVDTSIFDSKENVIVKNRKAHLAFEYQTNEQIVKGELHLKNIDKNIKLLPSNDFDILDTLRLINNSFFQFKIRFKDISNADFLSLLFEVEDNDKAVKYEIPLLPFSKTTATFYGEKEDLYIGEIRKFEIITNQVENLQLDGEWKENQHFNYRLEKVGNQAFIYIDPKSKGEHILGQQQFKGIN